MELAHLTSIAGPRARITRLAAAGVLLAGLAACTAPRVDNQSLVPDQSVAAYDARSLDNPGLRAFLGANLGREQTTWDFEALSWVAFYYSPTLDVARAQWERTQAGRTTAAARPNPNLGLTPGFNTSAGGGVSPWFPSLSLDFLFETARKRELRTEAARLDAEAARQAVFASAWQVRAALRQALLEWSLAGRRVAASAAQLEAQRRIVAVLEQRQSAGAIASGEVGTARLALVRAEAAAAGAQRQEPVARQHVAQILGLPGTALAGVELVAPAGEEIYSGTTLAAARRQSLQSRADILGALAHYEAVQAALALEVAKQRPDLHLGPGYQWDQGENKWSLSLSFELPLFNHHEGPLADAIAARREAAAQFTTTQAGVIAEIDGAIASLAAARAQMATLQRTRTETERQEARLEARRKAGGADQLELQGARLELAATQLAMAEAEGQVAAAAGSLEDALQVPFANFIALDRAGSVTSQPRSP